MQVHARVNGLPVNVKLETALGIPDQAIQERKRSILFSFNSEFDSWTIYIITPSQHMVALTILLQI